MLDRKNILTRIINDPTSTAIEREEAERELRDAAVGLQCDEDALITSRLSRQPWEERAELPAATLDLFHALTYWPVGLELEKIAEFVDLLITFHGRTLRSELKAKGREAISQWVRLARRYNHNSKTIGPAR
jgi:hypothetical protein